jgi:MarR family transcriptional regulator for hemolysin
LSASLQNTAFRSTHEHTLFAVSVNGPDDTMTIIAKRINMSSAALVRTLNDLEMAGYIERVIDHRNRRAKLLRLTAAGEKTIFELFHDINRVRKLLLAGVSMPEIELVTEILDRMDANLDDMLASGL